jgi:hypothetical protein
VNQILSRWPDHKPAVKVRDEVSMLSRITSAGTTGSAGATAASIGLPESMDTKTTMTMTMTTSKEEEKRATAAMTDIQKQKVMVNDNGGSGGGGGISHSKNLPVNI